MAYTVPSLMWFLDRPPPPLHFPQNGQLHGQNGRRESQDLFERQVSMVGKMMLNDINGTPTYIDLRAREAQRFACEQATIERRSKRAQRRARRAGRARGGAHLTRSCDGSGLLRCVSVDRRKSSLARWLAEGGGTGVYQPSGT